MFRWRWDMPTLPSTTLTSTSRCTRSISWPAAPPSPSLTDITSPLQAGDLLLVEPGEAHTFVESSDDYLHFVVQAPFVAGDKRSA